MQAFAALPNKPDEQRIAELREPWAEGALGAALELRGREPGIVDFDTSSAFLPPALFNRDPAFERSVFIPGASRLPPVPLPPDVRTLSSTGRVRADGGEEGAARQEQQRRESEHAAWKAKLVVADPVFQTGGATVAKPAQTDRCKGVLQPPARKLALVKAAVMDAPVSMYLEEPPLGGAATGAASAGRLAEAARFTQPGVDFHRMIGGTKSCVAKAGVDQGWYGELHDRQLHPA